MKNKKYLMASVLRAILRLLILIVIPIILVKYMREYFSYLGISISSYGLIILITGILYILFKFLEEIWEDPRYKMAFGLGALFSILLWAYYLLNRGYFSLHIDKINITVSYQYVLTIFLVLVALRFPEIIMKYYLELQRYDQRKKSQNSAAESS